MRVEDGVEGLDISAGNTFMASYRAGDQVLQFPVVIDTVLAETGEVLVKEIGPRGLKEKPEPTTFSLDELQQGKYGSMTLSPLALDQ